MTEITANGRLTLTAEYFHPPICSVIKLKYFAVIPETKKQGFAITGEIRLKTSPQNVEVSDTVTIGAIIILLITETTEI